jgi:hypothetical protein
MAYNDVRSYITVPVVAQNIVSTASAAVATTTTTGFVPVLEPSWLCSLACAITVAPASKPPSAWSAYALVYTLTGTTTTTKTTTAVVSTSGAVGGLAYGTFTPNSYPIAGNVSNLCPINVIFAGTGTASETETIGASQIVVGLAPQFV